jgi:hypothetical protein
MPTTGVWRRYSVASAGVLLLVTLSGCSADVPSALKQPVGAATSEPATSDGTYDPTPEDEQQLEELMTARADAVRDGDQRAFLATVDPGQPKLRARQKVLFQNLVELQVDTLWYDLAPTYLVPAPVPGQDPVLHPQVLEHLKLPATLSSPVANKLDLTFVKRGDQWLLGAERAPGAKGSVEDPQERPWFGVPIAVRRDGDLTVLVDAAGKDQLDGLVDVVRGGVQRDADILGVEPDERVLVDATSNGLVDDFGAGVKEQVGAVTFPIVATDLEGTAADVVGIAIKINPDQVEELISEDRLLWHELTHYLLSDQVGSPVWLSEGVASWVEWQPARMSGLVVADDLYDDLQRAVHELPDQGVFYGKPEVHYPISQAAVQWLVDRDGIDKLLDLMAAYTKLAKGGDSDAVTGKALRRVYDISEKELVAGTWETLATLHH